MQTSEIDMKTAAPFVDDVLRTAMDVGEGILRCGGEIRRVEDTITRICLAYGAEHVEVFTITSLIIASVRMADGSYSSQTRRILQNSTDLHRLRLYNEISRDICSSRMDIEEAQRRIKQAKHSKPYPTWVNYAGGVIGAGGFALFFGGSWLDALAAAVIGFIIMIMENSKPDFVSGMAQATISSFVAGVLCQLCMHFGLCHNVDTVIIGTIMLMIPGMTIGTAIRDMLCGDIATGSLRLTQSLLLACVIALGYGAAMILMGGILV